MSRLDPLRERQDYLDAIEAERERQVDNHGPQRGARSNRREALMHHATGNPSVERHAPMSASRTRAASSMTAIAATGCASRKSERSSTSGNSASWAREDLATHAYGGHREEMQDDLRNLAAAGTGSQRHFRGPGAHSARTADADQTRTPFASRQSYGPARAGHLLRASSNRAKPITTPTSTSSTRKRSRESSRKAASNPRVVLDFELKRKINRDIAKLGREARPEIARSHGLRVVRGRIPVPDVRIEYEKPNGEMARVDLELVTEHYRGSSLADKVKAGFSLYTPRGEGDRLRRVLDQQELTAEILSL